MTWSKYELHLLLTLVGVVPQDELVTNIPSGRITETFYDLKRGNLLFNDIV